MVACATSRGTRYQKISGRRWATYHSAKSARDRDRLRQEVLERLGWQVHRVWSTDWFRDPQGETSRIVARVEAARG